MSDEFRQNRRRTLALLGAAAFGGCTLPDSPERSPTTATTPRPSPSDASTSTGSDGDEGRTLTIGVLAPLSEIPWAGRGMVRGARIAAERLATGTLTPELVVVDTERSPAGAKEAYSRLEHKARVDVTVGGYLTRSVLSLIPLMESRETVHVTTGAYGTKLARVTRERYDMAKYQFRTGPLNDAHQARAARQFLRRLAAENDVEPIGLVVENSERFDAMAAALEDGLGDEVEVSMFKRTSSGVTYWKPNFDEVEAAGTRLLFAVMHPQNGAVRQWADGDWQFALGGLIRPLQNPRAAVARAQNRTPPPFEEPDDVESTFTAVPYAPSGTGRWESFAALYRDRYGSTPPFTAATTYDAVLAVTEVADELESWAGDRFVEALEAYETTDSVTLPRLSFHGRDAEYVHDPVWSPGDGTGVPAVVQWQDGEQVPIHPDSVAEAPYRSPG